MPASMTCHQCHSHSSQDTFPSVIPNRVSVSCFLLKKLNKFLFYLISETKHRRVKYSLYMGRVDIFEESTRMEAKDSFRNTLSSSDMTGI